MGNIVELTVSLISPDLTATWMFSLNKVVVLLKMDLAEISL